MTITELIDTLAAQAAAETVAELYGSSINLLTPTQRAAYIGEIAMHFRDSLTLHLAEAAGVIRAEQPTPSQFADRDEFDAIVKQFKQEAPQ